MPEPVTTPVPSTPTAPVPPPTPSPTSPNPASTSFTIPEQYAKEPWAQGIKSVDDLCSQFKNAQELIGRKGAILPTEKSTPEEVKIFRTTLGVPETPEGYEFKTIEPLKALPRDSKIDNVVKNELYKNGVPKAAAENIILKLEEMVYENAKPQIEAYAKQEKEFAALKLATFGDKVETASAQFEEVIGNTLGPEQKHLAAKLKELPPEARLVTIAFAKAIHDKYVGEHKIASPGAGGKAPGTTPDIKAAFRELSDAKIAVRNDQTMPQHIKDQRLRELNIKMVEVGNKASAAGVNLFD